MRFRYSFLTETVKINTDNRQPRRIPVITFHIPLPFFSLWLLSEILCVVVFAAIIHRTGEWREQPEKTTTSSISLKVISAMKNQIGCFPFSVCFRFLFFSTLSQQLTFASISRLCSIQQIYCASDTTPHWTLKPTITQPNTEELTGTIGKCNVTLQRSTHSDLDIFLALFLFLLFFLFIIFLFFLPSSVPFASFCYSH